MRNVVTSVFLSVRHVKCAQDGPVPLHFPVWAARVTPVSDADVGKSPFRSAQNSEIIRNMHIEISYEKR